MATTPHTRRFGEWYWNVFQFTQGGSAMPSVMQCIVAVNAVSITNQAICPTQMTVYYNTATCFGPCYSEQTVVLKGIFGFSLTF